MTRARGGTQGYVRFFVNRLRITIPTITVYGVVIMVIDETNGDYIEYR